MRTALGQQGALDAVACTLWVATLPSRWSWDATTLSHGAARSSSYVPDPQRIFKQADRSTHTTFKDALHGVPPPLGWFGLKSIFAASARVGNAQPLCHNARQ